MKYAKLMVAASEHDSDMRYAAKFNAPDSFIYLATPERKMIVVSCLEFDRARKETNHAVEVVALESLAADSTAAAIMALCQKYDIDTVLVPYHFPLGLANTLQAEGLSVMAETGSFMPEREFKSEAEIMAITAALRITENGMRRAFKVLAESEIAADNTLQWQGAPLSSERLRREIVLTMAGEGAMAESTIVAGGVQSACPHCEGSGVLYAHTPIVMDIFPRHSGSGYWGDLTRTVVKGTAPKVVKLAFDAVLEAGESAKKALKPGVIPAEIHQLAADILTKRGFPTGKNSADGSNYGFFHGLGHGVGLDIHEQPRLNLRNHKPLRGNEVITVEPGVYYPEWGGIRLEDMVVIRAGHAECLTKIETFLEVK